MELSFERGVLPERSRPYADALERGAWHGAWTLALGGLPGGLAYFARYESMDLPWGALGTQLGTFLGVTGACYGAGIALGEAASRSVRGVPGRVARVLSPALGGALAGALPGAFAAEHFGRIDAPFFGTLEILFVGVLSFFLFGAAHLRTDEVPTTRATPALGVALLAPLAFGLALWAAAPETAWVVDFAVLRGADAAPSLALFGALFGACVGALFGALFGLARAIAQREARLTSRASPTPRTA